MFADQPSLVARHVLMTHVTNALRWSIGDPHTHSGEAPFRAAAPADRAPGRTRKHGLRRDRLAVRDVPLPRATAPGHGEDQRHVGGIDFLMTWDADSPKQTAFTQRLTEWCAQAIAGIREHAPEAHAGGSHAIDLLDRNLRFAAQRLPAPAPLPYEVRRSSGSPAGTSAARPSPAPGCAPALLRPASGSWPSCPAPTHMARPRLQNGCPSSAAPCHRS